MPRQARLDARPREGLHYENSDEANLVLNPGENEQPRKVAKGVVLMGVDSSGC